MKNFENHPKVAHCIRNESNSGSPFKQWKKGMDLAKYDWIWVAESDDFSELDFLNFMTSNLTDDILISFSNSIDVNESGEQYFNPVRLFPDWGYEILESSFLMKGKTFIHQFLRYKNYLNNASSVIFRKPSEFPDEVINMKYSGDWYFWIYLLKNNGEIQYLNNKLNYFRYHNATTRIFIDNFKELEKKKERFSCIIFSQEVIGLNRFFNIRLSEYYEDVENYFHIVRKFGRLKTQALFPKIPFFLYPIYYLIFLKSLLPKKFRFL